MSLRFILALTAVAAVSPAVAATVIDFESAPAGPLSSSTYAGTGAVLTGFTVFNNTFGGAVVVPSGVQYANAMTGSTVSFTSGAEAGTVGSVSFTWAGLNAGGGLFSGATVDALDTHGTVLDSVTITPEGPNQTVASFVETLTGPDIASLTFTTMANPSGNGLSPLDDLTFGAITPVPEPAAWALMIAGFGVVGASLRRKAAPTAA